MAVRLLEAAREGGVAVADQAIEDGLTSADWPARLERMRMADGRQVLLDAAHNAEGAAALPATSARWHPERPALVVGVMRDKDTADIVGPLLPLRPQRGRHRGADAARPAGRATWRSGCARHRGAAARGGAARRSRGKTTRSRAVAQALEQHTIVVVAGSIFLVGPVRERLISRAILP